jgi:membrane protein DedA with SNARE-associated domain
MSAILQALISYILLYKYTSLFVISFIAAFIVPIPSGNVLMVSSGFASVGYLNIYWVIIISIIGNILGDNLGYWIARIYGKEVLSRIGFRRVLESNNFKKIENKFNKNPGFIVFASRFEVISTLSVNLLSGVSKTNYKKYFIYESIGSITQVCFFSFMGYFFADSWQSINTTIGRVVLVLVLIFILFLIFWGKNILLKK